MIEVDRVARERVYLTNGVCIRAPGPVSEAQDFGNVVIVVLEWMGGRRDSTRRVVRCENVYAYDETGRLRWRVKRPGPQSRPFYFTGFVEHVATPMVHEADGWHVDLDPQTGAILRAEPVK